MEKSASPHRAAALAVALAIVAALIAALAPGLAAAASTPGTALLDGESVTTFDGITKGETAISLEQYAAEHAGYTVKVVSGAEWEAMSAAEFAQYQVLIVGDPKCGGTALSAVRSAKTWTPVVMGTSGINPLVGNRAVVGTDPEYHYASGGGGARPTEAGNPSSAGAEHLVQDGIAFAGSVEGATGVYFDTSCSDLESESAAFARPAATPAAQEAVEGPDGLDITNVLDHLTTSTVSEPWKEDVSPPCGGEVRQIAANPFFDAGATKLLDSDIEGWGCSTHIAFKGYPEDWFPLAIDLETATQPTCGTDPESGEEVCGEAYVLLAGKGIVARAPNITLTPETHSDTAGGNHSVTATVVQHGAPVPGKAVSFLVTGTNTGVTGTCTTGAGAADPECMTDENGQVVFTYHDANGVGGDVIVAQVTLEVVPHTVSGAASPAAAVVLTTEKATAEESWTAAPVIPAPAPTPTPAPTPAPTPKAAVLAFGAAHLAASSRACVASSGYLAKVSGSEIATVTFTLDGHRLAVLGRANSHGTFALRVHVAGGSHRLAIKVTFVTAAHTAAVTIRRTLARCAAVRRVVTPRFTG